MLLVQKKIASIRLEKAIASPLVLLLVSLLAQGCLALATVPQGRVQYSAPVQSGNETDPSRAKIQKASLQTDARKNSPNSPTKHALRGEASWYGPGFHGKKTASGEIYDQHKFTAAHKTLPLGSKARVTNLENGNTVEVAINDRGPFVQGRVIDLSRVAAGVLGFIESGVAPVRLELLDESTEISSAQ